ncbi:MAG: hypothetical protein NC078_08900 [Ruminococcus sp.]|nr:hypothetical protein [Ruminococcus sp.]
MNILTAAFAGTSAQMLTEGYAGRILLPSDRAKDRELLIGAMVKCEYKYVIAVGQKPVIRNKVYIETTARMNGAALNTLFDCARLAAVFEEEGIEAVISENAGTSYCNGIYWNGLEYIRQTGSSSEMVFIHVPYAKNIGDIEDFGRRFMGVLGRL